MQLRPDPTPAEISAGCERIQAGWSEEEKLRRCCYSVWYLSPGQGRMVLGREYVVPTISVSGIALPAPEGE